MQKGRKFSPHPCHTSPTAGPSNHGQGRWLVARFWRDEVGTVANVVEMTPEKDPQ